MMHKPDGSFAQALVWLFTFLTSEVFKTYWASLLRTQQKHPPVQTLQIRVIHPYTQTLGSSLSALISLDQCKDCKHGLLRG